MTDEQYNKLIRYLKKKFASIDQSIEDLWERINSVDETETAVADNAVDIANRARRSVQRIEKRVKILEEQFEND